MSTRFIPDTSSGARAHGGAYRYIGAPRTGSSRRAHPA
jgi:hypothetical protein